MVRNLRDALWGEQALNWRGIAKRNPGFCKFCEDKTMRKTFMGVRLRAFREQRALTQATFAERLGVSPSYLNQIENNQRPLSVAVLLRLQSTFGADLQFFSEDEEARLLAQLQEVVAAGGPADVPGAEVRALAQQMPALARRVIAMNQQLRVAQERLAAMAAGQDERGTLSALLSQQPHEAVRDFFYAHHNHFDALDRRAEALYERLLQAHASTAKSDGLGAAELARRLEEHLWRAHEVRVLPLEAGAALRRFDPVARSLWLAEDLEAGRRAFELATQLAYLEAGDAIDKLAGATDLQTDEARALARIGLAGYFAGALILPYGRFLSAAETYAYDIDRLARRFGLSLETICHRLSTLQRQQARGVPFFFVRVDRAGNISKRQSATDFHFSRTGGTCPLWNVYEAFSQPGKTLTQLARMPDGRTYLWIARCVVHAGERHGAPARHFAIGLGCDLRHASRLVYAKGLALDDPDAATPIGAGCKVCERQGCAQRAFPALGKELRVEANERLLEPYAAR